MVLFQFRNGNTFLNSRLALLASLLITVPSTSESGKVPAEGNSALLFQMRKFLSTSTSRYTLSSAATSVSTARQICHAHGASLLYIQSPEELEILQELLETFQENGNPVWTSGVRYSNASIENLLVWSSTQEPFQFSVTSSDVDNTNTIVDSLRIASTRAKRFTVRNRKRAVTLNVEVKGMSCNCSCNSTLPILPPPPTCERPICTGHQPACLENERDCTIVRHPNCTTQEKNCTVDCGRPEHCRVIKPPVCKVVDSSKPRCRLENQNLGICRTKPQNCTIVKPSVCYSHRVECKQDPPPPCVTSVKPCKNPCSQQECSTQRPPCHVEKPPCETTTPKPCPPPPNPADCLARCKRSTNDKEKRYKCEQVCTNATSPECHNNSTPITECPPEVTVCPPPVTSCTRPFVDCSPIICQSNVQICAAPKLRCPAPTVICKDPEVSCSSPEVECPEPEVICDDPKIECSKPIVKCPDPVITCHPIITSCDPVQFLCHDPIMTCPKPVISETCREPTICPVQPVPEDGNEECPCNNSCGSSGGNLQPMKKSKSKRGVVPPEIDFVEKTECIVMQHRENQKTEWVAQSCDLKHHFICKS